MAATSNLPVDALVLAQQHLLQLVAPSSLLAANRTCMQGEDARSHAQGGFCCNGVGRAQFVCDRAACNSRAALLDLFVEARHAMDQPLSDLDYLESSDSVRNISVREHFDDAMAARMRATRIVTQFAYRLKAARFKPAGRCYCNRFYPDGSHVEPLQQRARAACQLAMLSKRFEHNVDVAASMTQLKKCSVLWKSGKWGMEETVLGEVMPAPVVGCARAAALARLAAECVRMAPLGADAIQSIADNVNIGLRLSWGRSLLYASDGVDTISTESEGEYVFETIREMANGRA